jgi:anthranilate/para-aminobenzoate synthase component I
VTEARFFDLAFGPDGPIAGELAERDLSISYDARRREVTAHPSGEVLGDDVFAVLEDLLDGDPETIWVGWFGYAARPDLPARPADGVPDAVWMRTRAQPGRVHQGSPQQPFAHSTAPMPRWYADAFDRVQEHLRAGDTYEVNLTHRHRVESDTDPVVAYPRLCTIAPGAPYAGMVGHRGSVLVSASPECFIRVDREGVIETRPITGTTLRQGDPESDREQQRLLRESERFRAENLIITDLCRNDLSICCEPGSVVVPALMSVEPHGSVHQLVTTVRGRLRADTTTVGAIHAMFPPGSMTGAPKLRTMEIIDEVELTARGVYSGVFGWIGGDGRCELAVVIRSLVRDPRGSWSVGTGGGITVHSQAADEWAESEWKVRQLMSVLS